MSSPDTRLSRICRLVHACVSLRTPGWAFCVVVDDGHLWNSRINIVIISSSARTLRTSLWKQIISEHNIIRPNITEWVQSYRFPTVKSVHKCCRGLLVKILVLDSDMMQCFGVRDIQLFILTWWISMSFPRRSFGQEVEKWIHTPNRPLIFTTLPYLWTISRLKSHPVLLKSCRKFPIILFVQRKRERNMLLPTHTRPPRSSRRPRNVWQRRLHDIRP